MDWLMGKARGVSRGFIGGGATSPTSSPHSVNGGNNGLDSPTAETLHSYAEPGYAAQCICFPTGLFHRLVDPFPEMEVNEWMAAHTVALFDNVSTLYDVIYDRCTCPVMAGPGTLTYVATDDRGKKLKCTAQQYIDSVLAQCQEMVKSNQLFPTSYGATFPPDLRVHVATICRNLFRVLVHLYAAHFGVFDQLEMVPHLNSVTRHFFAFSARFTLIDEKEIEVLGDLHTALFSVSSTENTSEEPPVSLSGIEPRENETVT